MADFLLKERHCAHIEKHLKVAEIAGASIEQQVQQRRAALKQDEEQLQRAFEAIQPQLEGIHKRRDALPAIFERYRREAQRELKVNFAQMINQLRADLPGEMDRRPLPTAKAKSVLAVFEHKKLCEEAIDAFNDIVMGRVTSWATNPPEKTGARQVLEPTLRRMFEEISDEVAGIDRELGEVQFKLTGWRPQKGTPLSLVSTRERILAGMAGLLLGDLTAAFHSEGGGWRGLAGVVVGKVAASFVIFGLGIVGTIALPILFAGAIVGGIVGSGLGIEKRVKARVLRDALDRLRAAPDEAGQAIDSEITSVFDQIETELVGSVTGVIEEEEQNIRKIVELNKRSRSEKTAILKSLEDTLKVIEEQQAVFKGMSVKARQTA